MDHERSCRRRLVRFGCVVLVLIGLPTVTADPASAGDDAWTRMPLEGAFVLSMAIDPVAPQNIYVGGRQRVSRSSDGGAAWSGSSSGLDDIWLVLDLAASPTTSGLLFAAGAAGQVYKSTDFGATFGLSSGGVAPNTVNRSQVVFEPGSASVLYWTRDSGGVSVYKSTDGGAGWSLADTGLPASGIEELVIDPTAPATLYAAFGGDAGVYKSTDGGTSWSASGVGLPDNGGSKSVGPLCLDPSSPSDLWTSSGVDGTLYRSTDGGASWSQVAADVLYVDSLSVHPTTGNLYAVHQQNTLKRQNIYRSTDGGATWGNLTADYLDASHLRFHPTEPSTYYAHLWEGVYRTTDGGTQWTAMNTGLEAVEVHSLAVAPSDASYISVGSQSGLFQSTDGGASFLPVHGAGFQSVANTGNAVTVSPTDPMTVIADVFTPHDIYHDENWPPADSGLVRTTDGGTSWIPAPNPHTASFGYGLGQTWTPLAHDPHDPSVVYAGSVGSNSPASLSYAGVYTSTDGGATFAHTSVGLPEGLLAVTGLATVATTPTTLYVSFGSFGYKGIYRSTDAGSTWLDIATGTALEGVAIQALAIDPSNGSTLLAGTSSLKIFRSTDGGSTWPHESSTLAGLPRDIAFDPALPEIAYAAAGSPYISLDGGVTWWPLTNGLPDGPLTFSSLGIDPTSGDHGRLIGGTWQQGLWEILLTLPLFADGFESGDTSGWF